MAACRPGKVKLGKEEVEKSMVKAHNNVPSHALAYFSRAFLGKTCQCVGLHAAPTIGILSPIVLGNMAKQRRAINANA